MNNGFLRVAAVSPKVRVADVDYNVENIIVQMNRLADEGADLIVFPELSVTGYTCGDLFHNRTLLDAAVRGLERIAESSRDVGSVVVIGVPIEADDRLYNCACVVCGGELTAIVPKTYIPNSNEFYEKRWFASGRDCQKESLNVGRFFTQFGTNVLIGIGNVENVRIGIEICEDLWTPLPPSTIKALSGADLIVNLSASNDLIGKRDYLRSLITQQSARCISGYVYAGAGFGESSTDLVFDGKGFIAENGTMLAETPRWNNGAVSVTADIDIEALRRDRLHSTSFGDCKTSVESKMTTVCAFRHRSVNDNRLIRHVNPHPFIPADGSLDSRCDEIINIQAAGLAQRLSATGCSRLIVGISGGLDSTLALLVAVKTFDRLDLDRRGIIGVTMPGFGTTGRTYNNALALMKVLGVTIREIPIAEAVMQHFHDIGHDPETIDVTYENSQARERTQILMDIANQAGGMVLGTGDLSELALGWATYNGDHMSMYGVNAGVPKTLVKHLVGYFATISPDDDERRCLLDIIDTPISPELTPADTKGNIAQKTEDLVGPYELHDFFLYYMLRYGFTPRRIYLLARTAFEGTYDNTTIRYWMRVFFRRFFNQQFKRSCLPDGPKVGSVCLSPRGDWRMPSDASAALWLKESESL